MYGCNHPVKYNAYMGQQNCDRGTQETQGTQRAAELRLGDTGETGWMEGRLDKSRFAVR